MKKSRLPKEKKARLIEHFIAGTTARTAAVLIGVNKTTAVYFYHRLRNIIAAQVDEEMPIDGEIEVDESYFGGHRKGQRGRGAAGKVPVFGLLKRGGKVYAAVINDAKADTLIPMIKSKVVPDSIVYSDSFQSYNSLDTSGFKHFRINLSQAIC